MAKDTFWFKHDSNASRDPKIMAMRSIYGYEGYGVFWAIVEALREQPGYKLNVSGKYGFASLAGILAMDRERLEEMVKDFCEEFDLFVLKDGLLYSESLISRMKKWDSAKANGAKGGRPKKTQSKPNHKPNQNPTETKGETQTITRPETTREEKSIEEKKRLDSKTKDLGGKPQRKIIPPEKIWVQDYFKEKKSTDDQAERFFDYYTANGWSIGRQARKMKDWQAAANNWIKNSNNYGKSGTISTSNPPNGLFTEANKSAYDDYASKI